MPVPKMFLTLMALGVISLQSSVCEPDATLQGRVVETANQPVRASIRIDGLAFEVETNEHGQFEIPYIPGAFTVIYESDNFYPVTQELNLYSKAVVPLEDRVLTRRVPGGGLWQTYNGRYHLVAPNAASFGQQPSSGNPLFHLQGPATELCIGDVLVAAWPFQLDGPPHLSLFTVDPLTGTILSPASSTAIGLVPAGDTAWRVTIARTGSMALLYTPTERSQEPGAWRLDVRDCWEDILGSR